MRYINNRFGHKRIFLDFLGISDAVIPGEIQHGYWWNEKWIHNRDLFNFFYPVFYWGGNFVTKILNLDKNKFKNVIGDPFLYLPHQMTNSQNFEQSNFSSWALFPSATNDQSKELVIKKNLAFILEAQQRHLKIGTFSLHPNQNFKHELMNLYNDFGYKHVLNPSISSPNWLHFQRKRLLESIGVFTNYIGPHIFRSILMNKFAFLSTQYQVQDNKIKTLSSEELYLLQSTSSSTSRDLQLKIVAEREMGVDYLRDKNFLFDLFQMETNSQRKLGMILTLQSEIRLVKNSLKIALKKSEPLENNKPNIPLNCLHCYSIALPLVKKGYFLCKKCYIIV